MITGGAGFIGSNIVEALLKDDRVGIVRVLDNFATGFRRNLEEFHSNDRFELMEGNGKKQLQKCEIENLKVARKSIVAKTSIDKNEIFTLKNLTVKRPGTGEPNPTLPELFIRILSAPFVHTT